MTEFGYDEGWDPDFDPSARDYCGSCGLDLHSGDCWPAHYLNPDVKPPELGDLGPGYEWYFNTNHPTPHWDYRWIGLAAAGVPTTDEEKP